MQLAGVSIALFFTLLVAIYKMLKDSGKATENENDDRFKRVEILIKDDVDKAYL